MRDDHTCDSNSEMERINFEALVQSGGPLVFQEGGNENGKDAIHYLVGVVSFGPKRCGTEGFPGQ